MSRDASAERQCGAPNKQRCHSEACHTVPLLLISVYTDAVKARLPASVKTYFSVFFCFFVKALNCSVAVIIAHLIYIFIDAFLDDASVLSGVRASRRVENDSHTIKASRRPGVGEEGARGCNGEAGDRQPEQEMQTPRRRTLC